MMTIRALVMMATMTRAEGGFAPRLRPPQDILAKKNG